MKEHLKVQKNNWQLGWFWLLKAEAEAAKGSYYLAHNKLCRLVKFAEKYGLVSIKLEAEIQLTENYIQLQDYAQGMLLITKTLASI